ncbi:hypothetical protein [Neorhizobium sp. T25_27]|uniref:hypothetical protein n=1 Tax=Neorhizobium sp. T25_27 TaxID=2093831 RepID=UPI00155ED0ED|nr:hypothetical protein [Neorhizobium sp. T25_27]
MLECHCKEVFNEYVKKQYGDLSPVLTEGLLQAFEQGAEAAKHGKDATLCLYSSVSEPERFLAWVEGFRCCSRPR